MWVEAVEGERRRRDPFFDEDEFWLNFIHAWLNNTLENAPHRQLDHHWWTTYLLLLLVICVVNCAIAYKCFFFDTYVDMRVCVWVRVFSAEHIQRSYFHICRIMNRIKTEVNECAWRTLLSALCVNDTTNWPSALTVMCVRRLKQQQFVFRRVDNI